MTTEPGLSATSDPPRTVSRADADLSWQVVIASVLFAAVALTVTFVFLRGDGSGPAPAPPAIADSPLPAGMAVLEASGDVRFFKAPGVAAFGSEKSWNAAGERPAALTMAADAGRVAVVTADGHVALHDHNAADDAVPRRRIWTADIPMRAATSVAVDRAIAAFTLANGNVIVHTVDAPEGQRSTRIWEAGGPTPSAGSLDAHDGRIAFALDNGNVRLWDVRRPAGERQSVIWTANDRPKVVQVATGADAVALVLENGNVQRHDIVAGTSRLIWEATDDNRAVAESSAGDGVIALRLSNGDVWIHDESLPAGDRNVRIWQAGGSLPRAVALDVVNRSAAIVFDGGVVRTHTRPVGAAPVDSLVIAPSPDRTATDLALAHAPATEQ